MYPLIQSMIKLRVVLSISQISQINNYCFRSSGNEPTQRGGCISRGSRCGGFRGRNCCSGSSCQIVSYYLGRAGCI